jgi:2'-5' RNA ligase
MATDTTSDTVRLFIGLWPTPAVRRALHAEQRRWTWPSSAALTGADNLHLTLHFIGAVPAVRVPDLTHGLNVTAPRFTLTLDAPEVWPNRCAVWCPSRVPAALASLHATLAQALRALALPVEPRPFRPHVTLARHASGALPPVQSAALHWLVRGYALVQSAAGRYTPIARYGRTASSPTRAGSG